MSDCSVRRALLALSLSAPLALALAPAAGAAGGDAAVGATVTSGNVHVTSTKGLSRVTVVLCGGDTVVADSWGGEQKDGDVGVSGTVQAVFVHSGNNTTGAAQALLSQLAGADEVKGNSTGAIAFFNAHACDSSTTTSTTTTSSSTTTVLTPTTIVTTDTPPPGGETTTTTTSGGSGTTTTTTTSEGEGSSTTTTTTTATTPTTPTTLAQTVVLGETLERAGVPAPSLAPAVSPATMARTGAGRTMFLVTLASGLITAGAALLSVFRRRRADSASSPC